MFLDAHSINILGEDMLDTRKENSSEALHSPKGEIIKVKSNWNAETEKA